MSTPSWQTVLQPPVSWGVNQHHPKLTKRLVLLYRGCMTEVTVHEAKTHLSKLLRRVEAGEDVVIKRGQRVVARLVPATAHEQRDFGRDRGLFEVPQDFDAPLPEELLEEFE